MQWPMTQLNGSVGKEVQSKVAATLLKSKSMTFEARFYKMALALEHQQNFVLRRGSLLRAHKWPVHCYHDGELRKLEGRARSGPSYAWG